MLEGTAQDPVVPPGQEETGKAQDTEDPPAAGCPQAVQISTQPWSIQANADWELQ